MLNKVIILMVSLLLCGCPYDNNKSNSNPLFGDWYMTFERNGAIGEAHVVFSEKYLDTYEIGNGQIMDEWYSGLDIDKQYKFTTDGPEAKVKITPDTVTYTSIGDIQTARVLELPDETEIDAWDIENTSDDNTYITEYKIVGNQLVIKTQMNEELTYTRTNN